MERDLNAHEVHFSTVDNVPEPSCYNRYHKGCDNQKYKPNNFKANGDSPDGRHLFAVTIVNAHPIICHDIATNTFKVEHLIVIRFDFNYQPPTSVDSLGRPLWYPHIRPPPTLAEIKRNHV